jgi:hypothetical protein
MKPAIAVTLIVIGGLLIVAPVVADYFLQSEHQANVMKIVEKSNFTVENKIYYLKDRYAMGPYGVFSLAAGGGMVAVGIWGAFKRPAAEAASRGQPGPALSKWQASEPPVRVSNAITAEPPIDRA